MSGHASWSEQGSGIRKWKCGSEPESEARVRDRNQRQRVKQRVGTVGSQRTGAGTRNRVGLKLGTGDKAGSWVSARRVCSSSRPGSALLHRKLPVVLFGSDSALGPVRCSGAPPVRSLWAVPLVMCKALGLPILQSVVDLLVLL